MTDELVAYLLDDLTPDRRAEVERRLATDACWQREFDRLRECFATTGDPARCVDEPPGDLVERTCCYVTTASDERSPQPIAAFSAAAGVVTGGSPWSLADLSVGGGVLLVLGMLMFPALRESRDATRRLTCQNNLLTLGSGLYKYQADHGNWLPTMPPDAPAGVFAIALADDVGIDRRELARLLVCPDSDLAEKISRGEETVVIPTYQELAGLFGEERARVVRTMGGSYAYRVGYYDAQGVYHHVKFTAAAGEPMLADAPRLSQQGVRSANHGGWGQNVVEQRMCVTYQSNSDLAASLDPIFVNSLGEHAAGCGKDDIVMLRGDRRPAWVAPVIFIDGFGAFLPEGR